MSSLVCPFLFAFNGLDYFDLGSQPSFVTCGLRLFSSLECVPNWVWFWQSPRFDHAHQFRTLTLPAQRCGAPLCVSALMHGKWQWPPWSEPVLPPVTCVKVLDPTFSVVATRVSWISVLGLGGRGPDKNHFGRGKIVCASIWDTAQCLHLSPLHCLLLTCLRGPQPP